MARKSGGRQSGYFKRFLEVDMKCEGETSREVLRGSDVYEVERLVEKRVKKSGKKVSSVSRRRDQCAVINNARPIVVSFL